MNFYSIGKWIVFLSALYMLIQNEYQLWTGKKENGTREKKVFRYFLWVATLGSLIIALMDN